MTSDPLFTDALVEHLRPWHAALQALGEPNTHRDVYESERIRPPPHVLWITDAFLGRQTAEDQITLGRVLEAVVLLDLLAQVDSYAWETTVLTVWQSRDVHKWIEDRKFANSSFVEGFRVGVVVNDLVNHVCVDQHAYLCDLDELDVVSSDFRHLYELMQGHLRPDQAKPATGKWSVRLNLNLQTANPNETSPMLVRAHKFVVQCKSNIALKQAHNKILVHVEEVDFDAAKFNLFTNEDIAVWTDLARRGVYLSHVPLLDMDGSVASRNRVAEMAHTLISPLGSEPHFGRVRKCMATTTKSPQCFCGILTAAQVSKSLRTMEIDIRMSDFGDDEYDGDEELAEMAAESCAEYWRWVAYALFSRHARHRISTLKMSFYELRAEVVDTIESIVKSPNPLAVLFDATENLSPMWTMRASRFHVIDPDEYEFSSTESVFTTTEPTVVTVIEAPVDEGEQYWSVILPGHGVSWVHKDAMSDLTEVALPSGDWESAIPSFEAIEFREINNGETEDSTMRLLKLIGRNTKSVSLHSHNLNEPADYWVRDVMRNCPHLEELILDTVSMNSLMLFVDAANAGEARLQRLVIGCASHDRSESFFSVLEEDESALSRHLRCLSLNFAINDDQAQTDQVVTAVLLMLKTNRRLHDVRIGFRLSERFAHLETAIQARFANVIEQKTPIRMAPFERRCKFAFLSTMHHLSTANARNNLDSDALRSIFEFAAPARTRHVEVTCAVV